jgi:hypothetical protein
MWGKVVRPFRSTLLFVCLVGMLSHGQSWSRRRYVDTEVTVLTNVDLGSVDDFSTLDPPRTRVRLSIRLGGSWSKLCGLGSYDRLYSTWLSSREALSGLDGTVVAERIEVGEASTTRVYDNGKVSIRNYGTDSSLFQFGLRRQFHLVHAASWCWGTSDELLLFFHSDESTSTSSASELCMSVKSVFGDTPLSIVLRSDFAFGVDVMYPLWTPFERSGARAPVPRDAWRQPPTSGHPSKQRFECAVEPRP